MEWLICSALPGLVFLPSIMQGSVMTTAENVLLIATLVLVLIIISNVGFSKLAEWRNPPIGKFLECEGVVLHYIERGDPAAPCVVLLHGNGSMIQDFHNWWAGRSSCPQQSRGVLRSPGLSL